MPFAQNLTIGHVVELKKKNIVSSVATQTDSSEVNINMNNETKISVPQGKLIDSSIPLGPSSTLSLCGYVERSFALFFNNDSVLVRSCLELK